MKKLLLGVVLLSIISVAPAQIGNVLKRAKDKVNSKANEKVNTSVDKTVDNPSNTQKTDANTNVVDTAQKNVDAGTSAGTPSLKVYSKYDFVPGEKIVAFEDFLQDAVGDFPDKWNTNASGETVTIEGKPGHWLMINRQGVFMPEFIDSLPDNFTFEFDLLCDNPRGVWALYTTIATLADRNHPDSWQSADSRFTFTISPQVDFGNSVSSIERRKDGVGEAASTTNTKYFSDKTTPVHIAVWRQKERIRVYFNEEKTWDLPKAMSQVAKYNSIVYWLQGPGQNASYFMSNLRLAVGAPDTRNKMLTENKWVTHGILFDVNSANIKPESYGTLKEMANVLKENPDLKVKIIGHTDADGGDAANLDLSKRRAASVKDELTKEFGIDAGRMETDGKGEGEPIDKNDTPAGKANNRRVEFIKL